MNQVSASFPFQTRNNTFLFQVNASNRIIPDFFIRNGGVASLAAETLRGFVRSPGEVAAMLAKPKEGNEPFFRVAAILMMDEDAKVVNGVLKLGRQPMHRVTLGTSVMFPDIKPVEGEGKVQVILDCRINDMEFPEEGMGRNISLPRDGKENN